MADDTPAAAASPPGRFSKMKHRGSIFKAKVLSDNKNTKRLSDYIAYEVKLASKRTTVTQMEIQQWQRAIEYATITQHELMDTMKKVLELEQAFLPEAKACDAGRMQCVEKYRGIVERCKKSDELADNSKETQKRLNKAKTDQEIDAAQDRHDLAVSALRDDRKSRVHTIKDKFVEACLVRERARVRFHRAALEKCEKQMTLLRECTTLETIDTPASFDEDGI